MSIKGIVTFWGTDVKKARESIISMRDLITKMKINDLLKNDLIEDIDRVLKVFNRGKAK